MTEPKQHVAKKKKKKTRQAVAGKSNEFFYDFSAVSADQSKTSKDLSDQ